MYGWRDEGSKASARQAQGVTTILVITAAKRSTVAKQLFVSKKFRVLKAHGLAFAQGKGKKGKRLRIEPKARRLYKSRITFCLTFRNNPHFLPGSYAQFQHWLSKAHGSWFLFKYLIINIFKKSSKNSRLRKNVTERWLTHRLHSLSTNLSTAIVDNQKGGAIR